MEWESLAIGEANQREDIIRIEKEVWRPRDNWGEGRETTDLVAETLI